MLRILTSTHLSISIHSCRQHQETTFSLNGKQRTGQIHGRLEDSPTYHPLKCYAPRALIADLLIQIIQVASTLLCYLCSSLFCDVSCDSVVVLFCRVTRLAPVVHRRKHRPTALQPDEGQLVHPTVRAGTTAMQLGTCDKGETKKDTHDL